MNPSTWQLNPETFTSAKGSKSCAILNKDGTKISFELGTCEEPVFSPFGAQCWQDNPSSRKSLEIDATPRTSATIKAIEQVLKTQLATHSQKIFGKILGPDKIDDLWHSPMQQKNPDYPARIRLKISPNTSFWDGVTKIALPPDTDLRGGQPGGQGLTRRCLVDVQRGRINPPMPTPAHLSSSLCQLPMVVRQSAG
jgi:hypothetical protein